MSDIHEIVAQVRNQCATTILNVLAEYDEPPHGVAWEYLHVLATTAVRTAAWDQMARDGDGDSVVKELEGWTLALEHLQDRVEE